MRVLLMVLLVLMLMGCNKGSERVVVERVVERVEYVNNRIEVEDLLSKVAGLAIENGGRIETYCGGVWVSEREILTAYHCLKEANGGKVKLGMEVKVINYEGMEVHRVYSSKLVKEGSYYDLGLLRVNEDMVHGVAKIGRGRVKLGGGLHIVGHTRGLNWSYIEGWVSAYRSLTVEHGSGPFMQMTAPIYYGDSGGGVFNDAGELVGVTSFIYKVPNVAFAVHLDHIQEFLK